MALQSGPNPAVSGAVLLLRALGEMEGGVRFVSEDAC